jgi:ribosomal protein S10
MADIYTIIDKAAQYEVNQGLLEELQDVLLEASKHDPSWDPYWMKIHKRLVSLNPAKMSLADISVPTTIRSR